MKTKQQGFTLIELVVVIVVLGIIGAVATAKFQDLSVEAADAAVQGVAAEISSGGALNMAKRLANNGAAGSAISGNAETCDGYANAMLAGGGVSVDPDALGTSPYYVSTATVNCSLGQATPVMPSCTLNHKSGTVAGAFTVYCVF
ncbi:MAG TPA: prepilin-type N-terminal cleavage/methylation domain-containing protein [Gammaproteobacteria bacterium]|nr:prepilin-type N-terminal cleavage/methylation domain-containing protein [Gammaproteobacteria bacterium]